jgi:hypothetical protein
VLHIWERQTNQKWTKAESFKVCNDGVLFNKLLSFLDIIRRLSFS